MRAAALAALALLLAGCVGPAPQAGQPGQPLQAAHASLGGWQLDCAQGSLSRARDPAWAQDCEARASHTYGAKEEVWLAVNPRDPDNVVVGAKDMNPDDSAHCVWNGVFVTHDGGKTWRDTDIGGKYADRQPTDPWWGYACNTDPDLQFTSNGEVHYGVELYDFLGHDAFGLASGTPLQGNDSTYTPGWKILLATSHDGGDTWPEVVTYMPDTLAVVDDFSRMTVVPTTQSILEMINLDGLAANVLASRDDGKSADVPSEVRLLNADVIVAGRTIVASPTGTVVLALSGVDATLQGAFDMWFARSTDDGRTFLDQNEGFAITSIPEKFNESQYRTGVNFEMAYDQSHGPHRGTLYAIYADNGRGNADIYVRSSRDDGKTWAAPVLVNDDNGTHNQFEPNIVVAADGSVHAFFMDKRWDPANKLIDITHAVSLDGGKTWANERVTTASFDGDLGEHQRGFPFIGDYIGIGASGQDVWGGFPDASNGQVTVVAAAHVARAT